MATNKTKIDWNAAKNEYLSNATLALKDISEKYGVSTTTVEERAAKEGWAKTRKQLGERASIKSQEKIVDNLAEVNLRHTTHYRNLQALATRHLRVYVDHADRLMKAAEATGKPVDPKDLVSAQSVKFFAEALKYSLDGERITLGLPTNVTKSENEIKQVDEFSRFSDEELEKLVSEQFDNSDD